MSDTDGPQEQYIVITELDEIVHSTDVGSFASLPIEELRSLRDRLTEIEGGLSFGRRLAQGRLDIVLAEFHSRVQGRADAAAELVERLPDVLAPQTRGAGSPRPVREGDLAPFADEIIAALDEMVNAIELAKLHEFEIDALDDIAQRIGEFERNISVRRSEVHRLIDDVQEEIIGRYRSGVVSVDDLLSD
ncbi:MAG: hypothetical protein M9952_04240 [Microthrixaceae bacterium]|nr:hypothetical protein [Microthrixaceae bacterium]MCO5312131.1 hypothetical protein [Microthrixaceae bacterium]HPB44695.1 hypothetical protein [Microthrixaceae bacterium]